MNRKLTVILASDIAGYSRLVAEDEEETLRRFAVYRGVFEDLVAHSRGRVFNTAGDAILAEFPSAVDALRCAIDVQESLRTRNLAYPPSRQMSFRMGMTIGDVVERNGDLLGDGVNVAARLQTLAPPGGICISKSVHEAVSNKLSASYSDMGLHSVKNIPNPVHVFNVGLSGLAAGHAHANGSYPAQNSFRGRIGILSALALATATGVSVAYLAGALRPVAKPAATVVQNNTGGEKPSTEEAPAIANGPQTAAKETSSPANATPPTSPKTESVSEHQVEAKVASPSIHSEQEQSKRANGTGTGVSPPTSNGEESQDVAQLTRLRPLQWASCRSEDTSAALTACQRLITYEDVQGADLALAHERLAYALRKQGKLDEAIAAFTKSLDIAKSSDAYNERGTAYFIKGQIDDAIADFSNALKEDPNNGDAFNNRAWAYYTTGRAQEALADADKAVTLISNKAYAWDTHGHIEEKLANRNAAIEDFRKALAIDPTLQSSEAGLKRLGAQ